MSIEFGIQLAPDVDDMTAVRDLARLADREGLDLLGVQDHPYAPSQVDTFAPAHEMGIWFGSVGPKAHGVTGRLADGWAARRATSSAWHRSSAKSPTPEPAPGWRARSRSARTRPAGPR